MKPTIQIVISPTGNVTMQVKGAKGAKCKELTRKIEEGLGTPAHRTLLPSYYEEDNNTFQTQEVRL